MLCNYNMLFLQLSYRKHHESGYTAKNQPEEREFNLQGFNLCHRYASQSFTVSIYSTICMYNNMYSDILFS